MKSGALRNMEPMSVTCETFHEERSPLKSLAKRNMEPMSVTPDKSGSSAALYFMLPALWNADSIVVHPMSPHCSMDCSLCAFTKLPPRRIFSRPPVMLTV